MVLVIFEVTIEIRMVVLGHLQKNYVNKIHGVKR